MAAPFWVSTVGILLIALVGIRGKEPPNAPLALTEATAQPEKASSHNTARMAIYTLLFIVALLAVFRVIHYLASVAIIAATLAITDRKALARVDYGLLATFLCFFVFAGNMARIPLFETALSPLMDQWGLLVSALTSQVISNVPAAVVLSHFTSDWAPLLVGVNIGGAGTFVGSLASLITIRFFILARREFFPREPGKSPTTSRFLLVFGLMNAGFFVVLLALFQIAPML